MQSVRTTRRVWGGNPNKYLTGGQMSEKRNLVHWSILALRDCKLPLTSVRHFFPVCINAFCKFSFAHYSSIGSRFWQTVCLFLLLIILQRAFLPVFAKMTPDTAVSTRYRRKSFPFSVILETGKWQPGRQKIFSVHSKNHHLVCPAKNGRKKAANLFQDLLLHVLPVGGGLFSFWIAREFQSEFEQAVDQHLDYIIFYNNDFIREKSVVRHASCPQFPRKAARRLFGYGSPLCCGCTRTICRFHAAVCA